MSVLVIAEHDNQRLKTGVLATVAAAARLGEVSMLVAGSACPRAAAAAAAVAGVTRVLVADAPHYDKPLAEDLAALVASIAGGFTHVLAPATPFGRNFLPRAAALLDVACISDVVAIECADTFVRPVYAGNALATVRSTDRLKLVTVRITAFDAAPASGGAAPIEPLAPLAPCGLARVRSQELVRSTRPELGDARVIVSGGRGMGSSANFGLLEALADKLEGAVGASRAAVDAGFAPNDSQVGQTGKIVAPELYVAVGISGAIQHLAGMKDSKVIVAINKDPDAPIFQIANYGVVEDLFKAVPELTRSV